MALSHSTATRNAIADAVVDRIDLGNTNPNGKLILKTASDTLLATLNFSNPAFGNAVNGVATANNITGETNAPNSGIASKFDIVNRDDVVIFSGVISEVGGNGDYTLGRVNIFANDSVLAPTLTYTAPL